MLTATEARYEVLALEQLHESPLNRRKFFDPAKLKELTDSVRTA